MRKTLYLLTLSLFLTLTISGCSLFSSSSGDEEQDTATVAADGEATESGDFAGDEFESADFDPMAMANDEGGEASAEGGDDESDFTEGGEVTAASDVEVEDNFGASDDYSDDSYDAGKPETATASATEDMISDDSFGSGEDALFADEGGEIPAAPMSENQEEDLFAQDTSGPIVDTPSYSDGGFSDTISNAAALVPVKKMKTAAYSRAGANINRLYVARSGDTMETIAEKLFAGQKSAEDLYSYNSHFRGKELKVGDKIYYPSPNNPNDSNMITYYEDNNIAPQYYTTQEGDNIRKLAKTLLGHERSWMEIYATNEEVDSKGNLSAGLQLRYWPDGVDTQMAARPQTPPPVTPPPAPEQAPGFEDEVAAMDETPPPAPTEQAMDGTEPPPPSLDEPTMDEPTEVAQVDAPPSGDMGGDDFNPPPGGAAGTMSPPAPPKPMAPPAPPSPRASGPMPAGVEAMGEDSMVMGALGGLLILAAIIMLVFIRRSRAKRVNFSQTQI